MQRIIVLGLALLSVIACEKPEKQLKTGPWTGHFMAMEGREIPFEFVVEKGSEGVTLTYTNAEEVLTAEAVELKEDSIYIRIPAFEGYFAGTYGEAAMQGSFIKESEEKVVAFYAEAGDKPRFSNTQPAKAAVGGKWETYFSPDSESPNPALGIFEQDGNAVTGTFRTTKGDYRYLEGVVSGDSLLLSTFDGAHLFLFEAAIRDSVMEGHFYSGDHFKEPFRAVRNPDFELQDENSLTFLNEGYETLAFSFPDEAGNTISLDDPRYQDKVVLVQLMGSWCPNCLDETKYLVDYVQQQQQQDLEVIALAFEYAKTPEKAFANIRRLKERIGVPYPIVLAQYGTSSKEEAREKLPMLNRVWSYPTLIFIGRDGKVRDIHTGFNGPATGAKYEEFKTMFTGKVDSLLAEGGAK